MLSELSSAQIHSNTADRLQHHLHFFSVFLLQMCEVIFRSFIKLQSVDRGFTPDLKKQLCLKKSFQNIHLANFSRHFSHILWPSSVHRICSIYIWCKSQRPLLNRGVCAFLIYNQLLLDAQNYIVNGCGNMETFYMTTADEEHNMWLKAPEKSTKYTVYWDKIVFC